MQLLDPAIAGRPADEVAREVRERGYIALERALTAECLARINADAGDLRLAPNRNWPGPVVFRNQRYLTHCLANSATIFDLLVRSWCFDVMRAYFGEGFRLTDHRVYATTRRERMQWHVDNKFDDSVPSDYPGLIFIFYLSDGTDGEFQLIDGSHRWSGRLREADVTEAFVTTHHRDQVRSLKMPAGSAVIYDTRIVHRAHRIRSRGFERRSLLCQVERKTAGGEPVLIDTRYARDLTPEQQYFLGFGAAPEYDVFPRTSLATMRPGALAALMGRLGGALLQSLVLAPVWSLNPDRRIWLKKRLRRRRGADRAIAGHGPDRRARAIDD